MNDLKNKKVRDFEKPFPGCMGRMVNLFDLGPVVPGNRLLTERAHGDGSSLSRGRPHTSKVLDPSGDITEDKSVAYELKSSPSKKSNGTPMKMLIAQEMSQETSSKQQPPSVVARLMGFDGLPAQQLASSMQRSVPEDYTRSSSVKSVTTSRCQQHDNDQLDRYMCNNNFSYSYPQARPECRDVYEVWQHPHAKGQNERFHENSTEKKMALVRQKFNEAKRLATDEKLRQSKEFQDAVEVLSSNRDLFLEFLKEPNSLFAKHLYDLQTIPPFPQTKRITVLKPSKTLEMDKCGRPDTKIEKHTKKQQQVVKEDHQSDRKKSTWTSFAQQKADNAQPTRIVVLKPSPGKTHDVMAVASSHSSLPMWLHDEEFCRDAGTDETRGSREMAKEITRQMRERLSSSQREETLPSSVLLNGYVGDDSSFNRSENECIEEGNLSDSEIMTPTSRHSWDYINRYGSPFSSCSFSRASYSPESSVTREAKKRLSERLAMMASTGNNQEQRQIRRSSSTLGEMLALPDKKNAGSAQGVPSTSSSRSCGNDPDLRGPLACFSSSDNRNEGMEDSPRNLSRSRSVPVSSTAYGKVELSDDASAFKSCKPIVQEAVAKPKSGKSSFRGKVSSLFFSRSKKLNKEKSVPSASARPPEVLPNERQPSVAQMNSDITECLSDGLFDEGHPSSSVLASSKLHVSSSEAVLSLSKPGGLMNSSENHDQPSPVSILEAPFEDDVNTSHSSETAIEDYGPEPSARLHHRSGLSAKSPLISVCRPLSWDDNVSGAVTVSYPWKTSSPPKRSAVSSNTEEEQHERFLFVQSLLLASGLQHEQPGTVISRWHSAESPLHPSLLGCKALKEDEEQNESIRRQRRSERRLLFDSVNEAIREMVSRRSDEIGCSMAALCKRDLPAGTVEDQVWGQVRVWMSAEAKWFSGEIHMTMVVEGMVRNEVVERGWSELTGPELDGIGEEIEGKLLYELVEEMLGELTCL